jgi:DNA topoisomerase-3
METGPARTRYTEVDHGMPTGALTLVVAEKPSVARDIAEVLGARARHEGYLEGGGYLVTWAIGHLVELAEPHEMNPAWKRWAMESLPMVPGEWPLVVSEKTKKQFAVVKKLLRSREVAEVVCATDAGREGELIFRTIAEHAGARKPTKRLWISSLTPDAIRAGMRALKPASHYDALADAARGRSRADWLVGMNLSRAYSLVGDDVLSVGRVQTPTLAMIVERCRAIAAFVPVPYLEVRAVFSPPGDPRPEVAYEGVYVRPGVKGPEARRLPESAELAEAVMGRAKRGRAHVHAVARDSKRIPPPLLYDLSELQRDANRLFGMTASATLQTLQALYERHKLVSYPRTDSRHLSTEVATTLPAIVETIAPSYPGLVAEGSGSHPLGRRFVDDTKVGDHHAIVPTTARPTGTLTTPERNLYDLVCRRLLAAYHDDHVLATTRVTTHVTEGPDTDTYETFGSSIEKVGWKIVERAGRKKPESEANVPPGLAKGQARDVTAARALHKTTEPPPHLTDASLLTAMETAGKTLDDKELSDAMRERGLGTAATRASILETLLARGYVVRDGKALRATEKGEALVDRVHPHVKSPAMTGEWEAKLVAIERGRASLDAFMSEIEDYVRLVVGTARELPMAPRAPRRDATDEGTPREHEARPRPAREERSSSSLQGPPTEATTPAPSPRPRATREPTRGAEREQRSREITDSYASPHASRPRDLDGLLRGVFGLTTFRPAQREVCEAVASGEDVLLVMPTGAGKSLCYQLPGLARGGTTLVVSPLIALMEDQVEKLVRLGLRAARIHSGRDRMDSRAACVAYLAGELDYLFIAPERLRVPGFPEMLAKRRPTLVAIDEAHCISQWGHDFRPDYRMLKERLPLLRPAPVVALTATATPSVQDDIVHELGMPSPRRMIRGFRRDNLAIEVTEMGPSARADAIVELLAQPGRRPAIVYAPTRKETESLAAALGKRGHAAAYHAGMSAAARERAQSAFLSGKVNVIVATTAFGMGIDKADVRTVVHAALPATIEGYYQEIGRAGRDGEPSRAVLFHGYRDRKTHEFFLERDYPEPAALTKVYKALRDEPEPLADVRARARLSEEDFERALEKVWGQGGAVVRGDEAMRGGLALDAVLTKYQAHLDHKRDALSRMQAYADGTSCRMVALVRHFGDTTDRGQACGACDVCDVRAVVSQRVASPNQSEASWLRQIVATIRGFSRGSPTVGQVHRELEARGLERKELERLVAGLVRAGWVVSEEDRMEKDGETIVFRRLTLIDGGPDDVSDVPLLAKAEDTEPSRGRGARGRRAVRPKRERATPARRSRASTDADGPLARALRAYRASESKKLGVPAFRIFTDKTLHALSEARPRTLEELEEVAGIGPSFVKRHGAAVLGLVARS